MAALQDLTGERRPTVQTAPVRIYQSEGRVMVAAPLPGLEPQDITVTITGSKVTIQGQLRGPRQDERDLAVAEWNFGPYYREVTLPHPVDGARANATYGNGVLVLALPKVEPGAESSQAEFRLEVIEPTRGAHVGHTGRDKRGTTTAEHLQRQKEAARRASRAGGDKMAAAQPVNI
jgi:HSP20 family protein